LSKCVCYWTVPIFNRTGRPGGANFQPDAATGQMHPNHTFLNKGAWGAEGGSRPGFSDSSRPRPSPPCYGPTCSRPREGPREKSPPWPRGWPGPTQATACPCRGRSRPATPVVCLGPFGPLAPVWGLFVKILLRRLKLACVRQVPPSPGGDWQGGNNGCS